MKITRRKAILGTTLVGGALLIGYAARPYPKREEARAVLGHGEDGRVITTWVKVYPDNRVEAIVPHCDMGQGSQTALAQMLADEMDADWDLVSVLEAPAHDAFANADVIKGFAGEVGVPDILMSSINAIAGPAARFVGIQITGGSSAIRFTGQIAMRPTGAAAREMFVQAAADTWDVPVGDLRTENSHVFHDASGKKTPYGALIEAASLLTPPENPTLKTPEQFKIMGKPMPRFDVPEKVNGTAQYGIDTRVDGLKYAAIRHSPVFGGQIDTIDETSIAERRGVDRVIQLGDAVAVVADNTWRAEQAARALDVTFKGGDSAGLSSESMFTEFEAAVSGAPTSDDHKQGEIETALAGAAKIVEASYRAPFQAHAPMEPLNCTVLARSNGTAEVWSGSQNPLGVRNTVADTLDYDPENVLVHRLRMGGGFGRRADVEPVVQAAKIAGEMKDTPIKLTWSREQDMQQDHYRPAGVSRFRGGLDSSGNPVGWLNVYNWKDQPGEASLIPYAIDHQHIGYVDVEAPVPTGAWRSVAHSRHGFFTESFADEMAHAAGADPYEFRRKLVAGDQRFLDVLDMAAEKADWGTSLPEGSARGIALHKAFGSITAQVAEVTWRPEGGVSVDRIVCVVDCGELVNPDTVQAQLQGGVLYGLSAALYGEIKLSDGRVEQSNFNDYRVVRLADAPRVETHVIRSGAPMGGIGEPGTPAAAPAVANAVFAATGKRLRNMPFNLDKFPGRDQDGETGSV